MIELIEVGNALGSLRVVGPANVVEKLVCSSAPETHNMLAVNDA